jgi:hypothetical protein
MRSTARARWWTAEVWGTPREADWGKALQRAAGIARAPSTGVERIAPVPRLKWSESLQSLASSGANRSTPPQEALQPGASKKAEKQAFHEKPGWVRRSGTKLAVEILDRDSCRAHSFVQVPCITGLMTDSFPSRPSAAQRGGSRHIKCSP